MVSRSDIKRRRKDGNTPAQIQCPAEESPKRTKVHAQRKFAQGSANMSSPVVTPVKDKAKTNGAVATPNLIPSNRPKTEDFLTFLCFRGTPILPPRLDFFNVATIPESIDDESCPVASAETTRNSRASSASISSNRQPRTNERNNNEQVAGPSRRSEKQENEAKRKSGNAVQALRKKYQEQRLANQRVNTLNKLAQKVKGKNMVRTRSSAHYEEVVTTTSQTSSRKVVQTKHTRSTRIEIHTKKITTRLLPHGSKIVKAKGKRRGLRSGGQLPAGSVEGLKSDRKIRQILQKVGVQVKQKKGTPVGKTFASSLSDFSSDDDQPLLKKPRLMTKNVGRRGQGQNMAQKVKKRYANQRPNQRIKPQIMTRSRLQLTVMRDKRLREVKNNSILDSDKDKFEKDAKEKKEKDLKEKEKKEKESKDKEKKEKKELLEKKEKELKEKEKEKKDRELREKEKKERELKEKERKEKELKDRKEKEAKEKKEKELKDKERKEKELKDKEKKEKERKEKEKREREIKEKERKDRERKEKEKREKEAKERKEKELKEKERKEKELRELKEKERKEKELKELKEKERKEKELKELKEKERKEKELKEKKERDLKEKERKERELREKKEKEAKELKEKEKREKELREKELKEKERKEMELKEKERKLKEAKEKREQEIKREKEIKEKEKKEKELKEKKEKELREKKEKEAKEKKEKELKEKKEKELKEKKEKELKEKKEKELKEKKERELKELKEKKEKEKDLIEKQKKEKELKEIQINKELLEKDIKEVDSKEKGERSIVEKEVETKEKYKNPRTKTILEKCGKEKEKEKAQEEEKESVSNVATRPTRKTKQAAAFYMELLGKSLIDPDFDDDDDSYSMDSLTELLVSTRNEQRESESKPKAKETNWMPYRKSKNKVKSTNASKQKNVNVKGKSKARRASTSIADKLNIEKDEKAAKNQAKTIDTVSVAIEETVVDGKDKEEPPHSPVARRRSLRTSSFHVWESWDIPPEKPLKRAKTKKNSVKVLEESMSFSESFSDSDEEPLKKIALKSQASIEKVVEKLGVDAEFDEKVASTSQNTRPEENPSLACPEEVKSQDIVVPVVSRGIKDALRESITHTPFKFKKTAAKLSKTPRTKTQVMEINFNKSSEVKNIFDKVKPETTVPAKIDIVEEKPPVKNDSVDFLPKSTVENIVKDLKNMKVETMGLEPSLDKLVPVNNTASKSPTLDNLRLAKKATGDKKEISFTTNAPAAVCDIVSRVNLEDEGQKLHDQRNVKGKVNMSTEQIEKWLNDSCLHDEEQRKQWEFDKTTCQGTSNILTDYLPPTLKGNDKSSDVWSRANLVSGTPKTQEDDENLGETKQYSYQLDKFKKTVLATTLHLQKNLKSQESKGLNKRTLPESSSKAPKTVGREGNKTIAKRKSVPKQNLPVLKPTPPNPVKVNTQVNTSHKNVDTRKSSEKDESDIDAGLPSSKEISPVELSFTSHSEMDDSLSCDLKINSSLEDLSKDESKVPKDEVKQKPIDRTPTRKSIFHKTRPFPHKIKERKDLKPNANAFSPENESSVYAFENEPELPPMSKPFRRLPARDSRASSVATSRSEDDVVKLADVEMSPGFQSRLTHTTVKSSQDVAGSALEEDVGKTVPKEMSVSKAVQLTQTPPKSVPILPPYSDISKSVEDLPQLGDEELASLAYTNTLSQTPLKLSDLNSSTSEEEELAKLKDRLQQESQLLADQNRASNSIAVQVNLDTDEEVIPPTPEILVYQQSMECSTQTEEDDDDDSGHLFYIPLQPGTSGSSTTPSGMIQGVAVKLDQTGPNQRVIMRAKLVTKPPSFNRDNMGRSLLGQPLRRPVNTLLSDTKSTVGTSSSSGTYPPVGTVQPTARTPVSTAQKVTQPDTLQQGTTTTTTSTATTTTATPRLLPPDFSSIDPSPGNKILPLSTANPTLSKQVPKAVPESFQKVVKSPSSIVRPITTAVSGIFQKTVDSRPLTQEQSTGIQSASGALPGTVKWALPNHPLSNRRDAMTDSPSNFFVTPTPDKVLVAKKEAFISAVPPLAPLSYSVKKPVATITSKPVLKTTVMKPVQVQSPAVVVKASSVPTVPAVSKATTTGVVPALNAPSIVEKKETAVPSTSSSSIKSTPVQQKRAPKVGTKKWNIENPVQTCRISNMSTFPTPGGPAHLVEAPTFHPTEKEFQDPIEFIDKIRPVAEKFGLCRVVPPQNFKPECKVSDDMRFTAYNQYVHKTLHRWGANVKEMMAIKKYLATQSIALTHPPWIGGMEIDLPRLYQTVQGLGGLKEVIEKKRWQRVADEMKITKSAQDRVTKLDDIYCKYLLPYETLSSDERSKLFADVEKCWSDREKKELSRREASSNMDSADESPDDDDDCEECIVKGRSMPLNQFYRIARNTMSMWFRQPEPPAGDVETEYWRHVTSRQSHVCVHSGSIESSRWGYGFPVSKNSPFARHPWNLKVLTNNNGSVLRSMGPIMGVTVPTLHVGMVFTTCCWYRDPHGLPWIEYMHSGASKIWYGIPDDFSSQFRTALTKLVPRYIKNKTIWLPSDTAMIPPPLLVSNGVSLSHTVQEPGQFIVVFPKAFTSTICTGYLVSESVYFAQPSWLTTAEQVFKDIRVSCEPSMFSLERLLFSIALDTRSNVEVLKQILPMVQNVREQELELRKELFGLGLKTSDRLPLPEGNAKKRKMRPAQDDEVDYECEICRANLYISLVTNSHEEGVYCLPHAVELLSTKKHHLKYCKLLYTYDQAELNELVQKLEERIEAKSIKKSGKQTLPSSK